jgi:pilus assembly protein Flp/PilA
VNGATRRGTVALHRPQASAGLLNRVRLRGRPAWLDCGATSVEYALMVGLIAVVIVASVTLFGQNTIGLFNVPSSAFNP